MSKTHSLQRESAPVNLTADQARPDAMANAIMVMLSPLTEFEREVVLRKLNERVRAIATPRAGRTLEAVVIAFDRTKSAPKELSIPDIKTVVEEHGVSATPKEIYNALGYLTRKKHIRNVGYGRYMIDGFAVITTDNLSAELGRYQD